jgi:hypothetical protein
MNIIETGLNAMRLPGVTNVLDEYKYLTFTANQGKIVSAFQSLGQAVRLALGEEFIRKHYLQVRALYIERARLENI